MIFNFKTTGGGDGKYLPLTGGEVDGIVVSGSNSEVERSFVVRNGKRRVSFEVTPDGAFNIWDSTNQKHLMQSSVNGSANTFNGTASGNLPLTGGTITGTFALQKIIGNGWFGINKNHSETADYGTQLIDYDKDGNAAYIEFGTNMQPRYVDRNKNTHHILHTGNMADHVLSKTGGRLTRQDNVIMELESTYQNFPLIGFYGTSGQLGNLGFNGVGNPCYAENNGTAHTLHHDGNSAKVHIGSSAPSDTTALWIDTSA